MNKLEDLSHRRTRTSTRDVRKMKMTKYIDRLIQRVVVRSEFV